MVTQMIEIGEEAGKVSEMLDKIADFYDTEVDATIKGLTSMIEPLMIMFVGSIVGVIAGRRLDAHPQDARGAPQDEVVPPRVWPGTAA